MNVRLLAFVRSAYSCRGLWRVVLSATALGVVLSGCAVVSGQFVSMPPPIETPTSAPPEDVVLSSPRAEDISNDGGAGAPIAESRPMLAMNVALEAPPAATSTSAQNGEIDAPDPAIRRTEASSRRANAVYLALSPTPAPTVLPNPIASPTVTPIHTAPVTGTRPFTYTVAFGDTLSSISAKFGVTVRTITGVNGLGEADVLAASRELTILPISGYLYVVAEGDTLFVLADRYHVIPEEIAASNGLSEPYLIRAGDKVLIPEAEGSDTDRSGQPTPAPQGKQDYFVAAGDSLVKIALRFGVSVDALVTFNNLDPAKLLAIGQHLTIPAAGVVGSTVQKGDTVTGIATASAASVADISQTTRLGESSGPAATPSVSTPTSTTTPTPTRLTATPTATASPTGYQVVAGDTLVKIAARFGVTVGALVAANALDLAKPLAIGRQLKIPSAALLSTGAAPPVTPTLARTSSPMLTSTPTGTSTRAPSRTPPLATPIPTPTPQLQPTHMPVDRSTVGARVVAIATKYIGARYVWGGSSPQTGFDCSGFVMFGYRQAGVPLPRDLLGQLNSGSKVDRGALQPGDLLFFRDTYKAGLSHDGIYIGGGQFIHAAGEKSGVIVSRLDNQYWASHYLAASRPY